VFSVAGAYAVYTLLADVHLALPARAWRFAYGALLVIVLIGGALYPLLGLRTRYILEVGRHVSEYPLTLDGAPNMLESDNDYAVIMCLAELIGDDDNVVVVEASIGSYWADPELRDTGRVGALLGIPTVLGWENHENQWRGATYNEVRGTRPQDIQTLYNERRWDVVQPIINRYGIDYILYGYAERATFDPIGELKFIENLEVVCESGDSRVYRVGETSVASG
jgi:uncharacterized membrane protein